MTPLHYACFWGYEQICEVKCKLFAYTVARRFQDLIRAGAHVSLCNKRGLTPLDVCQPQVRQSIQGTLSHCISHEHPSPEIAMEHGQNVNQKIPYRDENWRNTKTRTRDATLSRYTGVDIQSLALTKPIAQSHSGILYRGKWQGNDIVARVLGVPEVTPRISRDFQTEFPALRWVALSGY